MGKMGISRDSRHKRRATGGRMPVHKKKRQFESGRPAANTKLMDKRIRKVRTMGGNFKLRALRLNTGNFNWASEGCTRKTKIINVIYNATSNELVRTNTLTKNTIVTIDATPFQKYVLAKYQGIHDATVAKDKLDWNWPTKESMPDFKFDKNSKDASHKFINRRMNNTIQTRIQEMLSKGALMASISSRPGQSGRCDG